MFAQFTPPARHTPFARAGRAGRVGCASGRRAVLVAPAAGADVLGRDALDHHPRRALALGEAELVRGRVRQVDDPAVAERPAIVIRTTTVRPLAGLWTRA
jgi:hypothetical protein